MNFSQDNDSVIMTDMPLLSSNNSDDFHPYSLELEIGLTIVFATILVTGLICNSLVILVVIKRPRIRTVTNIFIMNLAIADLLVMVFCVPATVLSYLYAPWYLGWTMCKATVYIQGVSISSSAYFLGAISLDRSMGVYFPLRRPPGLSKRQSIIICSVIWFVSLFLSLPRHVQTDLVTEGGTEFCMESWPIETNFQIYFVFVELLCSYVFPILFISISSLLVWHRVSRREIPQELDAEGNVREVHHTTRHRVGRSLAMVILSFSLSWLPYFIFATIYTFVRNIADDVRPTLDFVLLVSQGLGFWNSSVNPILYAFVNKKFWEMVKSVLRGLITFAERIPSIELV